MGRLVDGKWLHTSIITSGKFGEYERVPRTFRETISHDHPLFKPTSQRYHLYVSYACPWAQRALIFRELKGLQDHISVSVVHPDMIDDGWTFNTGYDEATGDGLYQLDYLHQIYTKSQPDISTTVSVPVLWDRKTEQIVNNESSEIIRIFNSAFNALVNDQEDYYPEHLQSEINEWNDYIYPNINNGVYRAGFAKTQLAYEEGVKHLFNALDKLDEHFSKNTFLVGEQLTEADVRLIPTLLRFDLVYYIHFKCARNRMRDFKHLSKYVERLYALPAINNTTNFEHIKRHYYYSHQDINPYRIVPFLEPVLFPR